MLIFPSLTRPDVWVEQPVDLIDHLRSVPWLECSSKWGCWLFGPYTLAPSAPPSRSLSEEYVPQNDPQGRPQTPAARRNRHVQQVTHSALDFDGLTPEQTESVLARVSQYRSVAYTTWSWGLPDKPGCRLRVVIALARPVPGRVWKGIFPQVRMLFPEADDCKDASRVMFGPSCRPGAERWRSWWDGPPLDLATVTDTPAVTQFTEPIPREILDRVLRKWWRANDVRLATMADALKRAVDGIAFAAQGARDDTTFALICELVREVKNTTPEAIVATLAPSLQIMGEPTICKALDMVRRAHEHQAEESVRAVTPEIAPPPLSGKTREYLSALSSEDPFKALCLQQDSDYWVLTCSGEEGFQYIPCKLESLPRQCEDKWAQFGITLTAMTDGKTRRLKPSEITQLYGTPIEGVVRSYDAQEPDIRRTGARRELVLPAARKRVLDPQFDADVDRWLTLLGGTNAEVLRDWIVLAQSTDRPLAALVFVGAGGTGKSLLAKSLAGIWTRHDPPKLERVLGDSGFNDEIMRCPIVLADEDLPRDNRGRVRSAEIRDFIQRGNHQVNAKFRNVSHLEGYARLVVAGNGDQVLDFGGDDLTPDDLTAIQARLLVFKVQAGADIFLQQAPVREWLENDTIAKHFLWLEATRDVTYQGRFGVPTGATFTNSFVHAQGLRSAIVEWVVKYVLNPSRVQITAAVDGERIAVRLANVEEHWQVYVQTMRPRTDRLARASRVFEASGEGLIVLRIEDLFAWSERANYCSRNELTASLKGLGEAQRRGLSVVK